MEEDIQFGILRIGSDLVELQEDQHETETSLPVFHPKSFSANWFNQVNDDPNLFNPSNKRDLDQFISLKMRKADYAFSIGNYYQCIQEIETLRSFVPVIKKLVLKADWLSFRQQVQIFWLLYIPYSLEKNWRDCEEKWETPIEKNCSKSWKFLFDQECLSAE